MEGRIRMRPPVSYAILCDGDFPGNADVRDRLMSCDVVVCCDGAASSFMRFRKPEFVVGDMDSLPEDLRQELADQLFPVGEQESNDLSKAFRWICSMLRVGKGRRLPEFSITVFGATGKREDHPHPGLMQNDSPQGTAAFHICLRFLVEDREQRPGVSYGRGALRYVVEGHAQPGQLS